MISWWGIYHRTNVASGKKKRNDAHIPVLSYFQFCIFVFLKCGFGILFQRDLVNTIGESAALGAAGVVLWGSMQYASSKVGPISLSVLRNHLSSSCLTPHPPQHLSTSISVISQQPRTMAQCYFLVPLILSGWKVPLLQSKLLWQVTYGIMSAGEEKDMFQKNAIQIKYKLSLFYSGCGSCPDWLRGNGI